MSLLAGMATAAIGALGGVSSAQAQEKANKANINLARENRAWQEQMANTSHQREMADLYAAGLNPILSAGGSGAPTPAGNVAQVQKEDPAGEGLAKAATAMQVSNMQKQNKLLDTQEESTYAQAQKNHYDSEISRKTANWIIPLTIKDWEEKIKVTANTAQNIAAQTETLKADLVGKLVEAGIDETEYGQLMRHLGRAVPMINAAGNAIPFRDILNAFDRSKGNRSQRPGPYGRR